MTFFSAQINMAMDLPLLSRSLDPPTQCQPALLALPAELLEYVCQLVYTPDRSITDEISLLDPEPPNKALLLACKHTLSVAWTWYIIAYRCFWTDHCFVIDGRDGGASASGVRPILLQHQQDISHINFLRIIAPNGTQYRLVDRRGGWKATKPHGTHLYLRMRIWLTRDGVDPSQAAWDGHGTVECCRNACEKYPSKVPFIDQICHTLRPDFSVSTTTVF